MLHAAGPACFCHKHWASRLAAGLLLMASPLLLLAQGRVGINTTAPQAMLHVKDSSVLFTGVINFPGGNPPASGPGVRMMWYADKAAFRAGVAEDNRWDRDNVGLHSAAFGLSSTASGSNSFAAGLRNTASGAGAMAFGSGNVASGDDAFAAGQFTSAMGRGSAAFGLNTDAIGEASMAVGRLTIARGIYSFVTGNRNEATGEAATAIGSNNFASGLASLAAGSVNTASGANSIAAGEGNAATGFASVALGLNNNASAPNSMAVGSSNTAGGNAAFAGGSGNVVNAIGGAAFGFDNVNNSFGAMVVGMYNDSIAGSNPLSPIASHPVLMVGNGTSSTARSNAFVVFRNGNASLQGELQRPATGTANLLPICYGSVALAGTVSSGTGNFTVAKTATGQYELTIDGESYNNTAFSTTVTVVGGAAMRIATTGAGSGKLVVRIFDANGALVDASFHFMVYKP